MPNKIYLLHHAEDTLLAGGLISAPAWAPWLTRVNELLTTLSLVVGLALALARLWTLLRDRQRERKRENFPE